MKRFAIATFTAALLSPALAQSPTFPFLQDGKLRDGWVVSAAHGCIEKSKAQAEAQGITEAKLVDFCMCVGGSRF
jgi:hypothetical protein